MALSVRAYQMKPCRCHRCLHIGVEIKMIVFLFVLSFLPLLNSLRVYCRFCLVACFFFINIFHHLSFFPETACVRACVVNGYARVRCGARRTDASVAPVRVGFVFYLKTLLRTAALRSTLPTAAKTLRQGQ